MTTATVPVRSLRMIPRMLATAVWLSSSARADEKPAASPPAAPAQPAAQRPGPDNLELVRKLHAFITATSTGSDSSQMRAYTGTVPRAKHARFQMVPIPGGEFLMGSPASEKYRKPDEGPQVKVRIDPFWMGAHEVTWDEYKPFMLTPQPRWKDGSLKGDVGGSTPVDAVSGPTSPYTDMTFGLGESGYPAISMTDHSALKYCQWLSAQTGYFYRLPTEAEWEYAARAGTTTTWFFGNDEKLIDDYAWTFENSAVEGSPTTHPVGKKKPNPWGLYDIIGNVAEWTLDQHSADWYARLAEQPDRLNPFHQPVQRYGRVVRGGSWDDDIKDCRTANRRTSSRNWKQQDPQLPKSLWHLTNAQFLGFRIVRPLKIPSAEEMHRIWNLGIVGEDK